MKTRQFVTRVIRERGGNVAILFATLSPVVLGAMGLGIETGYWYVSQRNQQNAADAAAIAAATNGTTNGYAAEAKAVAAQYGYVNGSNNVTVTATNGVSCPGGGSNCYSVTIANAVPLYLSRVLGYSGNTTVGGKPGVSLSASSIATQGTQQRKYCLLALSQVGTDLTANGGPNANFAGCSIMSDSDATCNGHNLNADYGDAHLASNGCGVVSESNVPLVNDPYSGLASHIPANTCTSYPQEPVHHGDPNLPASNQWSGTETLSGNTQICGDLQLTGNVTVSAQSGAVLVIENGQLDTNGYTMSTTSGSALTVVFSGTTSGTYTHGPTGGGTLNFAAPTSGTWSGIALYQDPSLTTGINLAAAGNSPTWDISGLVYLPHSTVTFSGAVNKSSNGQSCFVMVVNNITINGTADILSHGACDAAGLSMPTGSVPGRGVLVQ